MRVPWKKLLKPVKKKAPRIPDMGLKLELGNRPQVERVIAGALKDCIHSHGPITGYWVGSAAKRVYKALGHLVRDRNKVQQTGQK